MSEVTNLLLVPLVWNVKQAWSQFPLREQSVKLHQLPHRRMTSLLC